MHRCAVGAKDGRAHESVVISWALRWCVLGGVLLSRTLAGAVPSALSGLASGFGMGAGRFPVAVTTETIVRVVQESLDNSIWLCGRPPTRVSCRIRVARACWLGWVGCGPYSGRSPSVPAPHPLTVTIYCAAYAVVVVVVGVVVCVGLLVPVSSNRYRSSTSGLSTQ